MISNNNKVLPATFFQNNLFIINNVFLKNVIGNTLLLLIMLNHGVYFSSNRYSI